MKFCEKCHKAYKQRGHILAGSLADRLCKSCFDELVQKELHIQRERAGVIFWNDENAWKMDFYK
jgi:hypothetical protein